MPANVYECMFLLDTNKVASDVPAAAQKLHAILERNQAEVLASRPWDERRLAYPIKNHKKGLYYLTYFRTEGKNVVNIEHDCSLNEMIIRMMIIHVDEKLVEADAGRGPRRTHGGVADGERTAAGRGRRSAGGEERGPRSRRPLAEVKEE